MPAAHIVNCATNNLRTKEDIKMGRQRLIQRRRACPVCRTSVEVHAEGGGFSTCPRCGEWLVETGRWNRKLERLEEEPGTDFDETGDWERSLADRIE